MAQRLRLRQPARKTNEQSQIERRGLFETTEHRLIRNVASMKREANAELFCASAQLLVENAMRIQISRRQVDTIHRFRISSRDLFKRSKEIVSKAARRGEYA